MTEQSRAIAASIVGGIIGAVAGYMFFTDRGRSLRRQLEPAIEDMAREISQFRGTLNRAMSVANEGWQVLNEALGESGSPSRFAQPRQTNPF